LESYIVRIYRNAHENLRDVVGVVEIVGAEEKVVFTNINELWGIINPRKKGKRRVKTGRGNEAR
jgi:hypothetical protein